MSSVRLPNDLNIRLTNDAGQYPLSERVKEEANDGREKGVAVIVSINKHRNDAWTLPEDILDKVELQVVLMDRGLQY